MNFDMNGIYSIIEKLFNSKKKSKNIEKIIKSMIKKNQISLSCSLFMLKITIIIISYYPDKSNLLYKFYNKLHTSKLESKNILLENLTRIVEENSHDNNLDDELMDKIIFNTFELMETCRKVGKSGLNLFITILNEILINLKKVKLDNDTLISQIYLMFIRKSNKLVLDSLKTDKKDQVYFKIMEMCGLTIKIINGYVK